MPKQFSPSEKQLIAESPDADKTAAVITEINDAVPPPQSAHGDDDVMSQPPRSALKMNVGKEVWQQQLSRAKATWSKLDDADLAKVEGDAVKLAALLHQYYASGNAEIDSQISDFFKGIKALGPADSALTPQNQTSGS
jgi:hypothetical protein